MVTIQKWNDDVFATAGIKADVLRLDLLHPTVSGNKWLKLKAYLQQAKAQNKKGILTKGGPWSNHAHACAYACKALGLSCHLFIKGHSKLLTATISDCTNWGATVKFVDRTAFYNEPAAAEFARENNLLYIPLGGANATGFDSVTKYITQLNLPSYTHAICSVGTATTFAGLAFCDDTFPTIIGMESGTKDAQLNEKIAAWQLQLPNKNLQLLHQFTFGGYGKYTNELIHFMNVLYQAQQLPTDIVYTAKLFYGVKQLAAEKYFKPNSKLLVIHTGGLQGNRSLPSTLLQF